jgi:hypothetical protein
MGLGHVPGRGRTPTDERVLHVGNVCLRTGCAVRGMQEQEASRADNEGCSPTRA